MPKNILIFADGTGQIGGLRPDQKLSNVYKMYRAMRPGPASPISYFNQVAYYDPGLGAGELEGVSGRKIARLLEAAVGAGIEDNMIDCYEKIIAHYEAGDRIILIGFSRGAYTVRALANMMNLCGVPTKLCDGAPMPRSGPLLRQVATEAVKSVYSHGTGRPRGEAPYLQQREEKGRRFRVKYGSEPADGSDNVRGNVEPHFVGVFDTVAALQNAVISGLIRIGFLVAAIIFAASYYLQWAPTIQIASGAVTAFALFGYLHTLSSQIRYFEEHPSKPRSILNPRDWPTMWRNTHRAYWRKENYDRWLSPKVGFARHALSIDENRADFPRVAWGTKAAVAENDGKIPRWLDQIWFAGCHSDVGGSYAEDESRLSDIALQWMVDELLLCVPAVEIQESLLVTTSDPLGLAHEEMYAFSKFGIKRRWVQKPRIVEPQFKLHQSVVERLKAGAVRQPASMGIYRPTQLKDHPDAKTFFSLPEQAT